MVGVAKGPTPKNFALAVVRMGVSAGVTALRGTSGMDEYELAAAPFELVGERLLEQRPALIPDRGSRGSGPPSGAPACRAPPAWLRPTRSSIEPSEPPGTRARVRGRSASRACEGNPPAGGRSPGGSSPPGPVPCEAGSRAAAGTPSGRVSLRECRRRLSRLRACGRRPAGGGASAGRRHRARTRRSAARAQAPRQDRPSPGPCAKR